MSKSIHKRIFNVDMISHSNYNISNVKILVDNEGLVRYTKHTVNHKLYTSYDTLYTYIIFLDKSLYDACNIKGKYNIIIIYVSAKCIVNNIEDVPILIQNTVDAYYKYHKIKYYHKLLNKGVLNEKN